MDEFKNFLYKHFPHRWLNKKAEGTERLFGGLARNLAYIWSYIELLRRNNSVHTAEEIISELENEYEIPVNPSISIEFRRQRILARMRIQDSPVTKADLIKMLETLGLQECRIENEYNNYKIVVWFTITGSLPEQLPEGKKMLEENVRAHIIFMLNGVVKENLLNKERVRANRLMMSMGVSNFGAEDLYLNGRRFLDGSWRLGAVTGNLCLNKVKLSAGVINRMQLSAVVIADSIWKLNGAVALDGSRKLNAEIKREEI